jgi:hypothetical protein
LGKKSPVFGGNFAQNQKYFRNFAISEEFTLEMVENK